MHFTRMILPIVFVLSASTALAAKPGKTLICHVGNEVGPEGQVYDPDCVPDDSYDCSADAGKVDLISVSNKAAAKHIAEEGEDSNESVQCSQGSGYDDTITAFISSADAPYLISASSTIGSGDYTTCLIQFPGKSLFLAVPPPKEEVTCVAEALAIYQQITWCSD